VQQDVDVVRRAGRLHHLALDRLALGGACGVALGIGLERRHQRGEIVGVGHGEAAHHDRAEGQQRLFDRVLMILHPAHDRRGIALQRLGRRLDPQRRAARIGLGQPHLVAEPFARRGQPVRLVQHQIAMHRSISIPA
jgi:hypothetical protein